MSLTTALSSALDHLRAQLAKLQVGRAQTGMIDSVQAEQYGTMSPIKAMANISVPDAQTLRVEPWDKTVLSAIETAIRNANLGLNPQNMGDYLLIPVPALTEERRKQLVKTVHEEGEKARIAVRNARHDAIKEVKTMKDGKDISEDEAKDMESDIQKEVDQANTDIESIVKKKEADVMTV